MALESKKYAATSTPLADDGFREGFSLDFYRGIILVIAVLGGVRELGEQAVCKHLLVQFGQGECFVGLPRRSLLEERPPCFGNRIVGGCEMAAMYRRVDG